MSGLMIIVLFQDEHNNDVAPPVVELSDASEEDKNDCSMKVAATGFHYRTTSPLRFTSGESSEDLVVPLHESSPRRSPNQELGIQAGNNMDRLFNNNAQGYGTVRNPGKHDCPLHNVNLFPHDCHACFVCENCHSKICYNHHAIYSTIEVVDD